MKMDKDIPTINCTTVITFRNTKTGEKFTEKVEGPDIVQDITVQVSPKGLNILQKVMQNDKSKP
jgi:hypothetical protein|tara:strand:- start:121 stop:312 length:192 start_codon:yes stop_codon:yes gene_type:complete